ncbi:MAG TPA: hypothetical protein VFY63_14360 [Pseudorhizobium sp.]|nr:hypothetical protein [Pseudorhizobium sp.]
MPDIDRDKLAADTACWLEANGYSTRSAAAAHPGLNPAMISRACTAQVLSAASLLALCRAMGAEPMGYLVLVDRVRNQAVTAIGKRETARARP